MKRILLWAAVVLISAAGGAWISLALTARSVRVHPFFQALPQDRAAVIAHRGGSGLWPENTLEAFRGALAIGSDVLEMDVHGTAEGEPVVIHDETVDRTTDGTGRVRSFTLKELQKLDAAHHWESLRDTGVVVPSLRQVFESFPREVLMVVEIKESNPALTDAVVDLVQEFRREETTLLGSFHQEVLQQVRTRDFRLATHLGQGEVIPFMAAAWFFSEGLYTPPGEALLVPPRSGLVPVATRRFVRAARNRGVFFAVWTVNDPDQMRRLLARGVQGIITDRPDLAVSAATDAGL
ncbi:glycerophosphoryl diester phosphodiesterase [Alkalispirochaeta americana]|uniref:Glycerophosphoryl diester phosphodiesterase n=1 Tax=Alkalispirochaeta americana TaxID=159291 RepID=A0A1N6RA46_9SPIO|nr:glycerophosphodiester phosphodiesterase [Alkalispirochaeta americana]SIQ25677.1 glycerophosphoryl diester phosphodiesterase [Alkalispirochaeta americana]